MSSAEVDSCVADLRRNGEIRLGLFPSFFYHRATSGELQGVAIEIARALAERIGIKLTLLEYQDPPSTVQALRAGTCDAAFLGIDPQRAGDVDFTPPFMKAEFTFLVPACSSIARIDDADRPGTRVAIVRHHAMETALNGKLHYAEPAYAETPDAAFSLFSSGRADVLAGIRPGLLEYASQLPGSRVLEEAYGTNLFALAIAKAQPSHLAYLSEFVEHAKENGILTGAIACAGLKGIQAIGN